MHISNYMTICSKAKTKNLRHLLPLLIVFALLFSCRKHEDTVGADFLAKRNPLDLADGIDTTTLITFSTRHDSVATYRSRNALSYFFAGEMHDPEMGLTRASYIGQFTLPKNQFSFGTGIKVDSAVLQLAIINSPIYFHGNKETVQKLVLYELNEDLYIDSTYFSNRNYTFDKNKPLGFWEGSAQSLTDSIKLTNSKLPGHIRITITDSSFLNKLNDAEAASQFINNASFQKAFKGFILMPDNPFMAGGEGALITVDPRSGLSALVIYHNNTKVDFAFRADVKANKYEHVHKPGINLLPVMNGNQQSITYCQPAGGIKTRILIPHLFDYVKNQNIAISSAEIIFTLKSGSSIAPFTRPSELRLLSCDSLGRNDFLLDQTLGASYYGGQYNETTGEYKFNIIRHLQYVLSEYKQRNRNVNYGLNLIVPADNPLTAARAILDTDQTKRKVKLKLTYTVIK